MQGMSVALGGSRCASMLLRPGPGGNHRKVVARGLHMKRKRCLHPQRDTNALLARSNGTATAHPPLATQGGVLAGHMARNNSAKGRQATKRTLGVRPGGLVLLGAECAVRHPVASTSQLGLVMPHQPTCDQKRKGGGICKGVLGYTPRGHSRIYCKTTCRGVQQAGLGPDTASSSACPTAAQTPPLTRQETT